MIDRWETRASTDPQQIHHWWRHTPYSIGIATGPRGWSWSTSTPASTDNPHRTGGPPWASASGAGVLRVLARQQHTTVTPTYAVTTPSGGWHLYYTTPAGVALRNTHDVIGWKIDTRAHGGYVVAPGCPVPPSGYELIDDRDPVELPGWLHQALTPKPPTAFSAPAVPAAANPTGYTSAAVAGEVQRVRTALPGQHNAVLCRAAYALGQLIGAGLLDHTTARSRTHHRRQRADRRRLRLHPGRGHPSHHRRTQRPGPATPAAPHPVPATGRLPDGPARQDRRSSATG